MITSTRQCKLHPNKEFCHIHAKFNQVDRVEQAERVERVEQVDKIKKLIENKNKEITRLCKALEKKNSEIYNMQLREQSLENELRRKMDVIKKMKIDYDHYQIIKKYENKKHRLISKNIDIFRLNDSEFHELRKLRNKVVHELTIDNER